VKWWELDFGLGGLEKKSHATKWTEGETGALGKALVKERREEGKGKNKKDESRKGLAPEFLKNLKRNEP